MLPLKTVFKSLFFRSLWKRAITLPSDHTDCGPSALLTVLRFWGGKASLSYVRSLCHTDESGTTMIDLVRAAGRLGLSAEGVRISYEELRMQLFPCIAHIVLDDGSFHYIVLFRITEDTIDAGDPGTGIRRLTKKQFLRLWQTRSIVLLKPLHPLKHRTKRNAYRWLCTILSTHLQPIIQGVFLGLLCALLGLFTALFIRLLIDQYIPANAVQQIAVVSVSALILLILRAMAGYARQIILVMLQKRISTEIYTDFTDHIFRLPKKAFDRWRTGDMISRIHDSSTLQQALLFLMNTWSIDGVIILVSVTFLFIILPALTLLLLGVFIPFVLLILFYQNRLKQNYLHVLNTRAQLESFLVDSLRSIDTIRIHSAGSSFAGKGKDFNHTFQKQLEHWKRIQARISFIADIVGAFVTILLLGYGAYAVLQDTLTLGQLMSAHTLASFILPSAYRFILSFFSFQSLSGILERLGMILEMDTESCGEQRVCPPFGSLEIHKGSFSWPKGKSGLQDIDLTIRKGELTALWGKNGAGKSTLFHILARLYALEEGCLLIDGKPADCCDLSSYRKRIGLVFAQTMVMNDTLLENILLGRNPSLLLTPASEMIKEISALLLRGRIRLLTRIGERGIRLSEGEMRLVGYLRAVLDEPDILIIDEAFSGFDESMKIQILSLLKSYSRNHGVLIVTHERGLARQADRVVFMENGNMHKRDCLESLPDIPFTTDPIAGHSR